MSGARTLDEAPASTDVSAGHSVGLDLLRTSAIVAVLVSHGSIMFASWIGSSPSLPVAVSGFFGVELFFVLSGFLIGRLLLRIVERPAGWRDWLVFMARRWMRTLPLYYAWLAVLAVLWPPLFWVPGHAALWRALPWFATLTQNLAWAPGGWFGVSWSLAVEEWFYLTFSALLLGAAALFGRRPALVGSLAVFLLVPPLLRLQVPAAYDWSEFTSKVVPLRLDAIGFGVAVAVLAQARSALLTRPALLSVAGMVVIAGLWVGPIHGWLAAAGERIAQTFTFDATSFGFALLLPAADRLRRAPAWIARPAARVAAQSYGIYIIHLSILEVVGYYRERLQLSPLACLVGCLALIWLLSWTSYRWFESPILRRRPQQHAALRPVSPLKECLT